ncbi:MAG: hypothetical protein IJC15_01120 [Clostridia bacterium]|nr:hypothetical protein [Clostridia bacterium]
MKKALTLILAVMMIAAMLVVPTGAAVDKQQVVYRQTFDDVKTFEDLGWEKIETLTTCTGSWTVQDGALLVDNLKSDANPSQKDSYYVAVPDSIMRGVIANDYTVQWDMTYLDAGNAARYLVVLLNYDREMGNTYLSFHFRPKGYADFQTRLFGSWTTIDTSGSTEGTITRPKAANTDPANGDPICKYIWGKDYVDADTKLIMNEKMTIRMEVHHGKCVKVFMNDKFVTATDDAGWETLSMFNGYEDGYSEIAIKAGTTIKATLDNLIVITGIGVPESAWTAPIETVKGPETTKAPETTAAPAETEAPADTTAAPETTPAATAESGAPVGLIIGIAAAVVVVVAVVVVIAKKKKA